MITDDQLAVKKAEAETKEPTIESWEIDYPNQFVWAVYPSDSPLREIRGIDLRTGEIVSVPLK